MKKLITILVIAIIAVSSTFATVATTSFNGNKEGAPKMSVTLQGSLKQIPYKVTLVYGSSKESSIYLPGSENTISGLDLTTYGRTELFNVMISDGNLNKKIKFVTTITEGQFVGKVDNVNYTTTNDLRSNAINGKHKNVFKAIVKAGPNESYSVAKFFFDWIEDFELPAGNYVSTNIISISVE